MNELRLQVETRDAHHVVTLLRGHGFKHAIGDRLAPFRSLVEQAVAGDPESVAVVLDLLLDVFPEWRPQEAIVMTHACAHNSYLEWRATDVHSAIVINGMRLNALSLLGEDYAIGG